MEQRLLEFRKRKAAEKLRSRPSQKEENDRREENRQEKITDLNEKTTIDTSDEEENKFRNTLAKQREKLDAQEDRKLTFWERYNDYLEMVLKCILWISLFGLFIQLGFGAVYFIVSVIFLMYRSMQPRAKKIGPSAYSVFNKGCERIQGTFTAEQFESQLRHNTLPS